MVRILFVCSGGTCRSPIAASFAQKLAKENNLRIECTACAIFGIPSEVSRTAVEILTMEGIEEIKHGEALSTALMQDATFVLCMEDYHKQLLHTRYPQYKEKIFTLKEYVGNSGDILDPFGGSKEAYETAALQIKRCIEKLIESLRG